MNLTKGKKIRFMHERTFLTGRTLCLNGTVIGPGVGPHGDSYVSVHITPQELMMNGLDREKRHREQGMGRQVLLSRVLEEIEVGGEYTFYCEMQQDYEPAGERLRRYTGTKVTVVELYDEGGEESSPMWQVRTHDGNLIIVQEEEIDGWDRLLGQFFWPDGTYGPDHDQKFLINERDDNTVASLTKALSQVPSDYEVKLAAEGTPKLRVFSRDDDDKIIFLGS